MNKEKINYQLILDKTLEEIRKADKKPRLLLHSCCGPCSSYVLEYLSSYFDIGVFYYNPNIYPAEEYYFREKEQENLIEKMYLPNKVSFIKADYQRDEYYQIVKGLEEEAEGGKRCIQCYRLRLEKTARKAKEQGFEYFTSTLSISPHKDSQELNRIGAELADKYDIKYLFSDFKKRSGFKRSVELSKDYHMYRQAYCGCVFSFKAYERRKNMEDK